MILAERATWDSVENVNTGGDERKEKKRKLATRCEKGRAVRGYQPSLFSPLRSTWRLASLVDFLCSTCYVPTTILIFSWLAEVIQKADIPVGYVTPHLLTWTGSARSPVNIAGPCTGSPTGGMPASYLALITSTVSSDHHLHSSMQALNLIIIW